MEPDGIRVKLLEIVELMASSESQMQNQQDVSHVFVPIEIVEMFCTDTYRPKNLDFVAAFTESELKFLARLYGDACRAGESIEDAGASDMLAVLKSPEWRKMMAMAKLVMQLVQR